MLRWPQFSSGGASHPFPIDLQTYLCTWSWGLVSCNWPIARVRMALVDHHGKTATILSPRFTLYNAANSSLSSLRTRFRKQSSSHVVSLAPTTVAPLFFQSSKHPRPPLTTGFECTRDERVRNIQLSRTRRTCRSSLWKARRRLPRASTSVRPTCTRSALGLENGRPSSSPQSFERASTHLSSGPREASPCSYQSASRLQRRIAFAKG